MDRETLKKIANARRMPISKRMGELDEVLAADLLSFWRSNKSKDVLKSMSAIREARGLPSQKSPYLAEHYKQVALQELKFGGDPLLAEDYSNALDTSIVSRVQSVVGRFNKSRFGILSPNGKIIRHIDDPGQIRAIVLLEGNHQFFIEKKGRTHEIIMKRNEVFFINTSYPHWLTNNGSRHRVALLLNLMQRF